MRTATEVQRETGQPRIAELTWNVPVGIHTGTPAAFAAETAALIAAVSSPPPEVAPCEVMDTAPAGAVSAAGTDSASIRSMSMYGTTAASMRSMITDPLAWAGMVMRDSS